MTTVRSLLFSLSAFAASSAAPFVDSEERSKDLQFEIKTGKSSNADLEVEATNQKEIAIAEELTAKEVSLLLFRGARAWPTCSQSVPRV